MLEKQLKPSKIKKLLPADLQNVNGGYTGIVITGWECGGVYPCDTNATCTGTRCNISVRKTVQD